MTISLLYRVDDRSDVILGTTMAGGPSARDSRRDIDN